EQLGVPLFRKRGRGLALTEAGVVADAYARRILQLNDELLETLQGARLAGHVRIGCPQDIASVLPPVLARFASLYPRTQVELHIEGNAALVDSIDNGRLDLAVVIGHEDRPDVQTIGWLDVVWIAAPTFRPPHKQPLPLAMLGPQCSFRKCAVRALEAANIAY